MENVKQPYSSPSSIIIIAIINGRHIDYFSNYAIVLSSKFQYDTIMYSTFYFSIANISF